MKNINSVWLYLEPFTFIQEDSKYYLFYDSSKGKGFSYKKSEAITPTVVKLQDINNLYSVKISLKELANEQLFHFVETVQSSECGDIIEGNLNKPIILPPLLNLQQDVERLKIHGVPIYENILSYLHEVIIYINGECLQNCKDCSYNFQQCICCTKSENTLDWELLKDFLFTISYTGASITLLGGNIFQYKQLDELLFILDQMNTAYTLASDWQNIPDAANIKDLSSHQLLRLKILLKSPYNKEKIIDIAKNVKEYHINQYWEIYVTSIDEYEEAEILNKQLVDLAEVQIKPVYNKKNISFFEEYIYIDQDDLDLIKLNRQNIFALQALNTNDFGKITIMSDGKIYANINEQPIGYIKDSIKGILCKELESKNSWRRTRYDIEPCSQCRFKLICPSISNYERVMNRNNLCHIQK